VRQAFLQRLNTSWVAPAGGQNTPKTRRLLGCCSWFQEITQHLFLVRGRARMSCAFSRASLIGSAPVSRMRGSPNRQSSVFGHHSRGLSSCSHTEAPGYDLELGFSRAWVVESGSIHAVAHPPIVAPLGELLVVSPGDLQPSRINRPDHRQRGDAAHRTVEVRAETPCNCEASTSRCRTLSRLGR
jgi:hypothetical protein